MNRRSLLAIPFLAQGSQSLAQQGFTRLTDGKSLQGFDLVAVTPDIYRFESGVIICAGKPNGYFATRKKYRNFILRFDWRYQRPADLQDDAAFAGNSGLLLYCTGEAKVWPQCIEVQLMNRDAGNIFGLSGGKITAKKDAEAQKRAIKPVGQWNSEEVHCENGRIVARINGIQVAEGADSSLREGVIGWQSEGAEIHFRNLEIRELP